MMNKAQKQIAYRITNPIHAESGPIGVTAATLDSHSRAGKDFDLICDAMAAMIRGESVVVVFPHSMQAKEMRQRAKELGWPQTVFRNQPPRLSLVIQGAGEVLFTYAFNCRARLVGHVFDRVYIWSGCNADEHDDVLNLWNETVNIKSRSIDEPARHRRILEDAIAGPALTLLQPFDAIGNLADYVIGFDDDTETKGELAKALVYLIAAERRHRRSD